MDILVIKGSRKQNTSLVIVSIMVAAGCLVLIGKGFYPFLSWPLLLLFGIGIPFFLIVNDDDDDRFVMNDKGIYDKTLGCGVIPWQHIVEAQFEAKYGNAFICLKVTNPEIYLSKMNERQRQRVIQNRELGFTRFNVIVAGAGASTVDILAVVQKMIDKFHPPAESSGPGNL